MVTPPALSADPVQNIEAAPLEQRSDREFLQVPRQQWTHLWWSWGPICKQKLLLALGLTSIKSVLLCSLMKVADPRNED